MMETNIMIGDRIIGQNSPCYIIAEMSANHGQNIDRAIEIIHMAKKSGADCVKVQTYTADTITMNSDKEYFKVNNGIWEGKKLYNLYHEAHMPWEWQKVLKEEAEKIGLDFLATPFDKSAVDFLEGLDVKFYKIASQEVVDIPLIKYIASKGKPIILSTGMAYLGEIEYAVNTIRAQGNNKICLLKCSSTYPAIEDDMNLNTLPNLQDTFNCVIGLSDHTMGSVSAIAAVALGAKVIEKHICVSRKIETADSQFSMEPHEFSKMIEDIRQTEIALGKISYQLSEREKASKRYRKSIFVVKDIKKDECFTEENIKVIRPSHGLEPLYYDQIIGKRASSDIEPGTPLAWELIS